MNKGDAGIGRKCRREWEAQVEECIWGGTTNTKGFLKSQVETYHCGSFLKHVHL